ncbi:MAG: hypothetical protein HZB20_05895 [Chloroflexi bacterium]|nr:hypothetical protein [Chloroflexota bacterium]
MTMTEAPQTVGETVRADPMIRAAGGFAIASGIISAIGVVLLIAMFVSTSAGAQEFGAEMPAVRDILARTEALRAAISAQRSNTS